MTTPSPTPSEALLSEHRWVRALAHRLVRDAALADDLAQETCLRALESPPASESPRAWLAGVLRNVARQWRRAGGRRAQREELSARPEAEGSAADALVRMAVQQELVRAVLALEEPYRSVVVLRFYEDLPPRAIARREGVPVATVKTRLARGLAMLRARLDREHGGDGRSWAVALLPLARWQAPLAPGWPLAAAGVAALVVAGVLLRRGSDEPEPADRPAQEESELSALVSPTPPRSAREPVAGADGSRDDSGASADSALTLAGVPIFGSVIDCNGNPLAGVALALRTYNGGSADPRGDEDFGAILWSEALELEQEPLAISAQDGSFELVIPEECYGYLVSIDPARETVLAPFARSAPERSKTVVVAPAIALRGRVLGADGAPLSGADVRYAPPRARVRSGSADLYQTHAPGWRTSSDADGVFLLARVPAVPGGKLRALLEPFTDALIVREDWQTSELELLLELPAGEWLAGVVIDAAGQGVPRATVALGEVSAACEDDGTFRLLYTGNEGADTLCACAPGKRPVRLAAVPGLEGRAKWPESALLELIEPDLALAGRVLDENGAPLANQSLWLLDGTVLARGEWPVLLESLVAGKDDARHGTKTDGEGRFRLGGLEARDYRLLVVAPDSGLVFEAGPFAAGSEALELARPVGSLWPLVRGTVLDPEGDPVVGASVHVVSELPMVGVGAQYFGYEARGAKATTDEFGAFELAGVPREGARLELGEEHFVPLELELDDLADPLDLELTLSPWADLVIDVGSAFPEADSACALDAAGSFVALRYESNGSTSTQGGIALQDGASARFRIDVSARTLVLYDGRTELARLPLALVPGELFTLVR